MLSVTDPMGNVSRYEYDGALPIKSIDANGAVTCYAYDAVGNLVSETDALGNTLCYSYTPEGWLETITDAEGKVTRYSYDGTGSILSADYAEEKSEENTYNEIGLLITVTTDDGVTEYQYDEASRFISVTQPNGETLSHTYDQYGRMTKESRTENGTTLQSGYIYYALGRLTEFIHSDNIYESYAYDAVGNMLTKTANGVKTKYDSIFLGCKM